MSLHAAVEPAMPARRISARSFRSDIVSLWVGERLGDLPNLEAFLLYEMSLSLHQMQVLYGKVYVLYHPLSLLLGRACRFGWTCHVIALEHRGLPASAASRTRQARVHQGAGFLCRQLLEGVGGNREAGTRGGRNRRSSSGRDSRRRRGSGIPSAISFSPVRRLCDVDANSLRCDRSARAPRAESCGASPLR